MLGITTKDSVIFCGGLGYADIESKRVVDSSTLFRMGSITKMFVSLGILQLVREGKLSLHDELKKIAPEVPVVNDWEDKYPVRVVHLLEHTAGFDDMKLNKLYEPGKVLKGLSVVIEQKNSLICRWKPGERYAYSNPNYAVLGYLIEKFSGKPFDQYLQQLILQPLGMDQSNFNITSKLPQQETKEYYVQDGKTKPAYSVNMLIAPAGALWSTSSDMLKFVRFFLKNGDTLFPASLIDTMETPQSSLAARSGLYSAYALGNQITIPDSRFTYRGHGGLAGTCFSACNYNRETGVGFVVASNSNIDVRPIARLVADFIEQQLVKDKPKGLATQPVDIKEIAPWLGRYQMESPRNEIAGFKDRIMSAPKLLVQDGRLYFQDWQDFNKYELVQTAPRMFAWRGNSVPLFIFTNNDEGKEVMCIGGVYFEKVSNEWAITKRVGIILVVFFAVLSYLLAFVSIIRVFLRKITWGRFILYMLPCIGLTLLLLVVLNLLEVQQYSFMLSELSQVNGRTISILIGTSVFAAVSLVTLFFSIKNFRKTSRWFAVYFLLTGISFMIITIVLLQAGWIGLRTWAM